MRDYLRDAIRGSLPPDTTVWRYSEAFSELWDWHVELQSSRGVILWDKTPGEGALNLNALVSPVAWAVLFDERRRKARPELGPFPVLIVDMSSEARAGTIADYVPHLDASYVWLVAPDRWLDVPALLQAFGLLATSAYDAALALMRNHLAFSILEGDEAVGYHDIANYLGSLVLLDQQTDPLIRAVMSVLDALGLTRAERHPTTEPFSRSLEARIRPGCKFVLVDDQASDGWRDVLSTYLRRHESVASELAPARIPIKVISDPDKFLRLFLRKLRRFGTRGRRLCTRVLFLDLRLFGDDYERELMFFERLVRGARNLAELAQAGRLDPKWCLIDDGTLSDLERWVASARPSGRMARSAVYRKDALYNEALALLPRIIALGDVQQPIIIFSSSRQREVVEILKPYGSVVGFVGKPRFDRLYGVRDSRAVFEGALEEALEAANAWLDAAAQLDHVVNCPFVEIPSEGGLPSPTHGAVANGDDAPILAVYLDESGSDESTRRPFAIGGLAVLYRSRADLDAVDSALEETSFVDAHSNAWDLAFGWSATMPPVSGARGKARALPHHIETVSKGETKSLATCAIEALKAILGDRLVIPFGVTEPHVGSASERSVPRWLGDSVECADAMFNEVLDESLEILLHYVAPAIPWRPLNVWIHYASRRVFRACASAGERTSAKHQLRDAFGIVARDEDARDIEESSRTRSKRQYSFSFMSMDTHSLAHRVSKLRDVPLLKDQIEVTSAVAAPFRYFETNMAADRLAVFLSEDIDAIAWPRQMHYFADLFAKRFADSKFDMRCPETWWQSRCVTKRNEDLVPWLNVGRALRSNSPTRSVASVPRTVPREGHAGRWIRRVMGDSLRRFAGAQLLSLTALLRQPASPFTDRVPTPIDEYEGHVHGSGGDGVAVGVDFHGLVATVKVSWANWSPAYGFPYSGLRVHLRGSAGGVEPFVDEKRLLNGMRVTAEMASLRHGHPNCILPEYGGMAVTPSANMKAELARSHPTGAFAATFLWQRVGPRCLLGAAPVETLAREDVMGHSERKSSTAVESTASSGSAKAPASQQTLGVALLRGRKLKAE